MSKAIITRLFVGGTVAVIAGLAVYLGAVFALFTSGAFVLSGPDVVGFNSTPTAWALVGLCLAGCLAMIGGAVAGFVAWLGALINTAQLENKAWFVVLLVLGLWCFGFVAMIAYIVAGPDSTEQELREVQATA